ncbi:hypothetical protein HKX48_005884 [Thoreauomyces humboldtii]|nr:hypothetical protein HKX48_005884 [Thoreauomyces humboldtii]
MTFRPPLQQLRAIFPDTEPEVCEAALTANGGNVEAAINSLLEISHPSAAQPGSPANAASGDFPDDESLARAIAQQEQDEALARSLEEEDRRTAHDPGPGADDASASFREAREKVVAGANAFGETAKKKFKELYDKFTPKEGNDSTASSAGSGGRQQYNNLPDDDFDSLLDPEAADTPLGDSSLDLSPYGESFEELVA